MRDISFILSILVFLVHQLSTSSNAKVDFAKGLAPLSWHSIYLSSHVLAFHVYTLRPYLVTLPFTTSSCFSLYIAIPTTLR
jgi:hypothetical protein